MVMRNNEMRTQIDSSLCLFGLKLDENEARRRLSYCCTPVLKSEKHIREKDTLKKIYILR